MKSSLVTENTHSKENDMLDDFCYEREKCGTISTIDRLYRFDDRCQLKIKELFGDVMPGRKKSADRTERRNVILWSEYLVDYRDQCVDALSKYFRFDEIYSFTGSEYDSASNTLLSAGKKRCSLRGKMQEAVYFYFALLREPPQGISPLLVSQDGGSLVVDDNIDNDLDNRLSQQTLRLRDTIVTYFLKFLAIPFSEIRTLPRDSFLEDGTPVNRAVRLSYGKEILVPSEISVLLNLYERGVEATGLTFWDYFEGEAPYFLAEDGKWLTADDYGGKCVI